MAMILKQSGTSPVFVEVQSPQPPDSLPDTVIEVSKGLVVTYSSQNGTLTVAPPAEESR